jgi:pimeloyl-ACP methyl ester carboxylesterase
MDELRPWLDCAALDLPGYGESPPRPDGRYSIGAMTRTVATLIERQGRGPVHLIGNSLGGAICVRLAATRPDLVRSLTLICPALPDARFRKDLVRFPVLSIPWVGGWMLGKFGRLPPDQRVRNVFATCYCDPGLVHPERIADEVAALTRRDELSYANAALIGCMRSLVAEQLRTGRLSPWREAERITAPTLVIYGSHDRVVSPRLAGRAARTFRNSRVVVLPRTGHIAMMEHPAAVAAEIRVLLGTGVQAREFPLTPAG